MADPLAVALAIKGLGALAAAAAVGGALLLPSPHARGAAALAALVLTPVLVIGELWHSPQIAHLRAHAALASAAVVLTVVLVAVLSVLIVRHPPLLALLAAAALPFRIPVQSGANSANLLVPLYIVIAAGVVAYAYDLLRTRPQASGNGAREPGAFTERVPGRLEYVLVAAVGLYALQSLYSSDFEQALKNVAFFYVPFALMFKLLIRVRWTQRLLIACFGVLTGLAVLFAGIGFVEYATRHVLWNQKVIQANEFESYFRVNSLFFDPSIYGRFLAIVMIGLATTLLWPRRRREVALVTAVLVVLWAGLVLSFSQSSFVALLLGLAVLAGLRWDPRPVLFGAAVVAVLGVAVVIAVPGAIHLNLSSGASVNKASSGRFTLIRGGLSMFSDRPFWGFGSGSFAERFRAREQTSTAAAASASHTIPLTVAAEQGVIGLAVYLLVVVTAAELLFSRLGALRARPPPASALVVRAFLAAAFAALFFHTLLYAAFLEDPITWVLLALAVVVRRVGEVAPTDIPGALPRAVGSFSGP